MKSVLLLFAFAFWTILTRGQTVVEISKTQKVTKDGIEITSYQGKPLTGVLTEGYSNGKLKSWITIKDGLANGLWQEWYENGVLKFNAYWQNGKGHGLWEYYHENGVLRQEEFYNLDIPTGIFRDFYSNGQLKTKSTWLNGKKHGVWLYYNETGMSLKTETYEDGKLISTTEK